MTSVAKRIFFILTIICALSFKINAQCSPNSLEFLGGQPIYNSACGNNSYQTIRGQSLPGSGHTYLWEVSFSGSPYQTIVNTSNIPLSNSELSKTEITDFILGPFGNASGDYRIRRIVSDNSIPCSNTSEPVFLYYAQNQSSLSGGSITNLNPINCNPASGTLFLSGQTGPVLRWESSPAGTDNWTPINNITNTLNYSNLTQNTCFRALVDNICGGTAGSIDPSDKYSIIFCVNLSEAPILTGLANTTICQGEDLNLSISITSNLPTNLQWRKNGVPIAGATSATLIIQNASLTDAGTYDVLVSNSCGQTSSNTATVSVNEAPTIVNPSNLKVCAETNVSAIIFNSNFSGATFSWTNSNPAIGLAASGTGNLPEFKAINTSTSLISATITVYATINSCTGPPSTFNIEVEPLPQIINAIATNQSRCDVNDGTITITATSTSLLEFSIDGGLSFENNGGNFTGLAAGSYTIFIRNQLGCINTVGPLIISSPQTPPTPIINPISSPICEGNSFTLSILNPIPNTKYTWTGPLGFNAVGSSIIVPNASPNMSGSYSVIATINSCQSLSSDINVIISPIPNIIVPANQNFCEGDIVPITILNSLTPGASINWTNSDPSIGLAASGIGDIPSFTAKNLSNSPITATIKIRPSINGCNGPESTFNITINPSPKIIQPLNLNVCAGEIIPPTNFISNLSGTSLRWTNNNTSIGLPASGSGNLPSFYALNSTLVQQTATITIIPSLNGCEGTPTSFNIVVNPIPIIQSAIAVNETACNSDDGTITISAIGNEPLTYSIDGGITFVSNGGIFTGLAAGSYSVAVKNSLGCLSIGPSLSISSPGAPPQPNVQAYLSPVCEGENLELKIQNPDPLATYNWTGPKGFTATGVSIIRPNADLSMSGDYSVTASLGACVSISRVINLQVNPKPIISSISDQSYCDGENISELVFYANQPGTSFSWTNSNPNIGLAANGTGNLPSFLAINKSLIPVKAIISVTPSLNGCNGVPISFEIIINPIPNITVPSNIIVCSGTSQLSNIFTSSIPGTTFTWTNSNPTIGLAASGIGNLPTFTTINTSNTSKTAVITVTPQLNNCTGVPISYSITVNPLPKITNNVLLQEICSGESTSEIVFTSDIPGTSFNWTANASPNLQGFLTSGTGNIPIQTIKNNSINDGIINYTVTPFLNGCAGISSTYTILVHPLPTANLSGGGTACFGSNSLLNVSLTGKSPWTINYSDGVITRTIGGIGTNNYTFNVNANGTKTYRIISVSDANFCSNSASGTAIIQQASAPITANIVTTDIDCSGIENGIIKIENIAGGFGTFEYSINMGISWQKSPIFSGLAPGNYQINIRDLTNNQCSTSLFAKIFSSKCPPIALDDNFITDEEVPISGTVATNDSDPQGDKLNFTTISYPKNGSFTFNNDGSFTYLPKPGFWGIETIEYETCNSFGLCKKAILSIEVVPFTIVSLTPTVTNVTEGKKVTVSAKLLRPFKDDVIIKLGYSGVAIKNMDYALLDQFIEIRIPKGQINSTEKITIAALSDDELEGQENIQIEIISSSDPQVRIGSGATVIIEDNYLPPGTIPNDENNKYPINTDIRPDPLVSPNEDGLGNDFFKIDNIISFPQNLVLIYNRWGNLVFRMEGYNESDRVFKGFANTGLLTNTRTALSDGVYYYLITTKRITSGQKIETLNKGYFILKR